MSKLPISFPAGGKSRDELKEMYERMRPASDEVKVEYEEGGKTVHSYLNMKDGLTHSFNFWAGTKLPPYPETFVVGGHADITPSDGEPKTPPSGQLEDSVDDTSNVSNVFGDASGVVGQLLQ